MKKRNLKSLKLKIEKVANLTTINSLTGGTGDDSDDTNCGTGSDTKNKSIVVRLCPNSGDPNCPVIDSKDDNCPG